MKWEILRVDPNPIQFSVTLVLRDRCASFNFRYQQADALARRTLSEAALNTKGYQLGSGHPTRTYLSQAY